MGWTGTRQTRAQAVQEATRSHEDATCIAFTEVPDGVWSVWELTGRRVPSVAGKRIITLDLIEERDGYQMVKTMDETCGPCYYDCPPAYLELAQSFAGEAYSPAWRLKVQEYWNPGVSVLRAQERAWGSKAWNDSRDYEDGHSDADAGL